MQLIEQFFAVDDAHRVHTVAVYKTLGKQIYRLDDREAVEPLDERWFVTLTGDVLERVRGHTGHSEQGPEQDKGA